MNAQKKGVLYLLPVPLQQYDKENGGTALLWEQIPAKALALLQSLPVLIVESDRTALRLLSRIRTREQMDALSLKILNEHSVETDLLPLCDGLLAGIDCGFFSDAGVPCIADPGAALVAAAHSLGIKVVPVAGPSSIMLGLMASGMDAQRFTFLGYLPQGKAGRVTALRRIGKEFLRDGTTRIFIETPYRNEALWADCLVCLPPDASLAIGVNICGADEYIACKTISAWRQEPLAIAKAPAVFLLGRKADMHPSNTR
ncbi:MAG: SAM-dependent methyltransferase [Spirochaetaceae bacterium]|nr:SAM-dependent methyltransferase [Spirochaetaceae bacterium]